MLSNRPAARRFAAITLSILALSLGACAHGHHTTTRTETIECVEVRSEEGETLERDCSETASKVRTDHGHGCHGVISCSAHVVGEVVALPFRITGAVLDAVF